MVAEWMVINQGQTTWTLKSRYKSLFFKNVCHLCVMFKIDLCFEKYFFFLSDFVVCKYMCAAESQPGNKP